MKTKDKYNRILGFHRISYENLGSFVGIIESQSDLHSDYDQAILYFHRISYENK